MPPFGPFMSELTIFLGALAAHPWWVGALFITLVVIAALGLAAVLLPMLQGGEGGDAPAAPARERLRAVAPPLALAAVVLLLGVYLPRGLAALLGRVALLVGGGS